MDFFSPEMPGVYLLIFIVSALVALLALKSKLGYFPAFLICLILSIVLVVARIPYPLWFSGGVCLVTFVLLPKKKKQHENVQYEYD